MNAEREWAERFLSAWRDAWTHAPEKEQADASSSFGNLVDPVRASIGIGRLPDDQTAAFQISFTRSTGGDEFDVAVVDLGENDPDPSVSDSWRLLRHFLRNAHANWFPGRPLGPRVSPWHAAIYPADDACTLVVPIAPSLFDPLDLVRHHLDPKPPSAKPVHQSNMRAENLQHLYDMQQERERASVERWLFGHASELLALSGLAGGWWCALRPERAGVFGEGDGDCDILAGPIELSLTHEELNARHRAEAVKHPLTSDPGIVLDRAIAGAVEEGKLIWPPSTDYVVGWEVKTSRYSANRLQATHANSGRRVTGQLRVLDDRGVDCVGFLHLVVTRPHSNPLENPWSLASRDAGEALELLPELAEVSALPHVGYVLSAMGAVSHGAEHHEGAGGTFRRQNPSLNPQRKTADGSWRTRLREKLASMAPPHGVRSYVLTCPSCGRWRHSLTPEGSGCDCACGPEPRPTA